MSKIETDGYYDVTLEGCALQEIKNGVQYVLTGRTEDGRSITAYVAATNTVISRGENQGKYLYEVAIENLTKIGLNPNDPTDVESLNGKACNFRVDWEKDDNGGERLKVLFVNPPRESLKKEDRRAIFAKFGLGSGEAAVPATRTAAAPADDLNF